MNKVIIGLLLFATIFIVAVNFVRGFFRRLLGIAPKGKGSLTPTPKDILYEKDGTTVLRGEAHDPKE